MAANNQPENNSVGFGKCMVRTFDRDHQRCIPVPCLAAAFMAFLLLLSIPQVFTKSAHAELLVYTAGHSDMNLSYDGEGLVLRSFFGQNAVINGSPLGGTLFANPANVVTRVPNAAKFDLIAGDDVLLGFTGFEAGNGLWVLPQVSESGIPFLGLDASDLPTNDWSAETTWTIASISAPTGGNFSLWQWGSFDDSVPLLSTYDPSVGLTYEKLTLAHQHYNWGFTAEGVYDVEFVVSATNKDNVVFSTQPTVFRFLVGDATAIPEPSSLALFVSGTCVMVGRLARRYRKTKRTAEAVPL